jgi:protein TonB
MFEQTFVNTSVETRKPAAVAASLLFQSMALGSLLLLPLLRTELLPLPKLEGPVVWRLSPPPPLPPSVQHTAARRATRPVPLWVFGPIRVPTGPIRDFIEPESADVGLPQMGPVSDHFEGMVLPPPPPPPAQPTVVKPPEPVQMLKAVSVSKGVQAAKLIFAPKPAYPALAKAARVQGMVRLQAIIGVDGNVRNLQVMSGPPLLVKAALDAVSQWRYQPTLLTDKPVEVATEIDVNFTLSQ